MGWSLSGSLWVGRSETFALLGRAETVVEMDALDRLLWAGRYGLVRSLETVALDWSLWAGRYGLVVTSLSVWDGRSGLIGLSRSVWVGRFLSNGQT